MNPGGLILLVAVSGAVVASAQSSALPEPLPADPVAPSAQVTPSLPAPTTAEKLIWYLPNRLLDLADIFRLRLKVGPGLGVTARMTDYAAFYAGRQHTAWIGLPGPRHPATYRWPVGLENQRGIALIGVDATDDLRHPPHYGFSETDLGVHLGIVGAEAGIDAFEVADFLSGLFLIDLRGDDGPHRDPVEAPVLGSVIGRDLEHARYDLEDKPPRFDGMTQRLDYLETAVPLRLQGRLQYVDQQFAADGQPVEVQPPVNDLSFSIYVRSIVGADTEVELKPDLNLDVTLPNLEQRVSLFVESSGSDDLPDRDAIEREDQGWTVGARKKTEDWNLSADAGVRAKWLPEVYTRLAWKPSWSWDAFRFRFEQRVFWESDDGFGTLTSLNGHRWFDRDRWVYQQTTSGRITEESDGYEWQQSVSIGRATRLIDEARRARGSISVNEAIQGYSLKALVFGEDDALTQYRMVFGLRTPLYREFVIGELGLGPQWRDRQDWDTELRTDLGLVFLF